MIKSKILALKYRPQEFKDLIGQEVMTKTITNAIKQNKIPNAYLLTGIRGVGKTTTARLIAKKLNCLTDSSKSNCKIENPCSSCEEINNSNHIDVLEMDAASKTGIDDVRELIESSKYSPTNAKYKIFIIDEVHMLSKQAFNGLLKTLEEPPPSLKFILATTEARKIPVTILSRCQRFDLKRIENEKLFLHLKDIAKNEGGNISDAALKIIVSASEGSMRDGISLLDKALISHSISGTKQINEDLVRDMLGLVDKTKIIHLFKEILLGEEKKSLLILREMIENGIDVNYFLNDFLEVIYLFSNNLMLGEIEKDIMISEAEKELVNQYSKNLDMNEIGIFWQLTLKTIKDLKILNNENLALQMFIKQLIYIKNLDKKDLKNEIKDQEINISQSYRPDANNNDIKSTSTKKQLKSTNQVKTELVDVLHENDKNIENYEIKSFADIIKLAKKEKEMDLIYDLERNVSLVSFKDRKIEISFNEKLNKNFIKNLTEKLLKWTNNRWIISLTKKDGEKTSYEKKIADNDLLMTNTLKNDSTKNFLSEFPDAQISEIKEDKND